MEEATELFEDVLALGDEAVAIFDDSAKHFENKTEPRARTQRVSALVTKAGLLGALERRDQALAALNEVIAEYEDDDTGIIPGMILMARELREELLDEEPA
jgi:hypothetical protein